jgi:hypothetical protein
VSHSLPIQVENSVGSEKEDRLVTAFVFSVDTIISGSNVTSLLNGRRAAPPLRLIRVEKREPNGTEANQSVRENRM